MTNKRQITLEYEVAKFGPSGVGKVELWVTRDDGQSWQKSGGDMNVNTPLPGDAKVGTGALKQSLVVDLHEDGIYGFILTVKSGAGLGKPAPRSGDVPHMRVEVDTKAPKATLFRPEPDPTRRDTLILRWTAQDNNLGPTPFSLQWAEKKGGKWEPIGSSELPNSQGQVSSYAWQVPADIPHHVFLRLTVRDTAGNVAIAETDEPVLVDLNEPEVQSLRLGSSPR
jgi:hypothetical protein